MRYTVLWKPLAERALATIWMESNDRRTIANAGNEIDRVLSFDPMQQGESREQGRRIMFLKPLGVSYRILEDRGVVEVIAVWKFSNI